MHSIPLDLTKIILPSPSDCSSQLALKYPIDETKHNLVIGILSNKFSRRSSLEINILHDLQIIHLGQNENATRLVNNDITSKMDK